MYDMNFKIQSIVKFAIKRFIERNKLFIIVIYHLILMKIVS